MTIRRKGFMRRVSASPEYDPKLIGDIPADWEAQSYKLGVKPDPDNAPDPMAFWVDDGVGFAFDFPGTAGEFVLRPIDRSGTFTKWWARRDGTGDATWLVEYASTITGAFSSVGGTQPFITSNVGNADTNGLNWTTLNFVAGGCLKVTLVTFSGTGSCCGLTIGAKET